MYSLFILLVAALTVPIPLVLASTNQTADNEDTKHVDEEAVALIESTQSEHWDDDKDDGSDSDNISTVSTSSSSSDDN